MAPKRRESATDRVGTAAAILLVLALLLPTLPLASVVADGPAQPEAPEHPPPPPADEEPPASPAPRYVVGLRDGSLVRDHRSDHHGARVVERNEAAGYLLVEPDDPVAYRARAKADGATRYVEEDLRVRWIPETTGSPAGPPAAGPDDGGPGAGPQFIPNDPSFASQYGPQQVRADLAWDTTRGTPDAAVCVLDTGVRHTHEDLAGARWLGGHDFANGDADPADDHGHGTHVAGIAAATIGNGVGIAGMGNVGFYGVKVLDAGGFGEFSDIAAGITWCADHAMPRTVLSLSLGCLGCSSQAIADALAYATNVRGMLVVAASGNAGPCGECVLFPATHPDALAVACTAPAELLCSFSSSGRRVALAAPGDSILSLGVDTDDAYVSLSGTSMSTPHVSGAAALLWSHEPSLTRTQLAERLMATAQDLGEPGHDYDFGCGELDVRSLLDGGGVPCAIPPPPPPPANDAFADALALGATPFETTQTTFGASVEPGEPQPCGATGSTVWFVHTAPADGRLTLDTAASNYDTVLAAYTGSALDGLGLLACNDDTADLTSRIDFPVTEGTTYRIQAGGFSGAQGRLTLRAAYSPCPGPVNDCFDQSLGLLPSIAWTTSTTGATLEAGEPTPCGDMGATVWFQVTVPGLRRKLSISTHGPGVPVATFDTVLAVYTGSTLADLVPLACSDDAGSGPGSATLTLLTVPDQTYHIQLGGFRGATGTATLRLQAQSVNCPATPANDCFLGATPIGPLPSTITQDARGASIEPREPFECVPEATPTLWFRFRAPATGAYVLDTKGSTYDAPFVVYRGPALERLSLVGCTADPLLAPRVVELQAEEGVEYHVQVRALGPGFPLATTLVLSVREGPLPACVGAVANDCMGDAAVVPGLPHSAVRSTAGATVDTFEPRHRFCLAPSATVWYRYTAPARAVLVADTVGSSFDTVLFAYVGTAAGGPTAVDCNNDIAFPANVQSRLSFVTSPGVTYFFQVGGALGATGTLQLNLQSEAAPPTLPPNDHMASAAVVNSNTYVRTQSIDGATVEAGEPSSCQFTRSVWLRHTPTVRSVVDMEATVGPEGQWSPQVGVYTGAEFGHLRPTVTCRFVWPADPTNPGPMVLEAGTTYHYQVGGYDDHAGSATLRLTTHATPTNDLLAAATPLPTPPHQLTQSTLRATEEPREADRCAGHATVWYRFTAPASGRLTVDTTASSMDTVVGVYTGGGLATASKALCWGERGSAGPLALDVVAGTSYLFQVGGADGSTGQVQLRLQGLTPDPPTALAAVAGPQRGELSLSWLPPADPGAAPVTAYRVYAGASAGSLAFLAEVPGGTAFVHAGLPNAATRHYAVRAVNAVGESGPSNPASATTFGPPGIVRTPSAEPGVGQIAVRWLAPLSDGGRPILSYEVERGSSPSTLAPHASLPGTAREFLDVGLGHGETWHYRVRAVNEVGAGTPSLVVVATTFAPPGAPRDLTAQPGVNQVSLSWRAPLSDGGAPLTGYSLYRARGSEPFVLVQQLPPVLSTVDAVPFTGVYHYQVRAANVVGEGPSSNAVTTLAVRLP